MTPFACREAARNIHQGKVIAYPTEAVYGLGCDPLNPYAVARLLDIKQRPVKKGLILIAADFEQLQPYVMPLDADTLKPALASWPGPFTWLLPARPGTPYWLTGQHQSIAVRITAHPVARSLCLHAGAALVSTSANRSRQQPARSALQCRLKCPETDYIISGDVDKNAQPSTIRDLLSGNILRA